MIWNSLFDSKVSQFVNAHAIKTTQWCQTCVFMNKLESWASSFFQWRHVHHGPIYQENSSTEYSEGQLTRRILQDALLSVLTGETLLVYMFVSLSSLCACMFDYIWLFRELLEEKISLNFFVTELLLINLNIIWVFYFISSEEKYVCVCVCVFFFLGSETLINWGALTL